MKKYLSLGSALMLGVVTAKTTPYEFQISHKTVETAKDLKGNLFQFEIQHLAQEEDVKLVENKKILRDHHHSDHKSSKKASQQVPRRYVERNENSESRGRDSVSVQAEEPLTCFTQCINFDFLPIVANYYNSFRYVQNYNYEYCNAGLHQIAVCRFGGFVGYCWYDGSEWEWQNFMEPDGTPDQSLLTSVDTDYIYATSPSDDYSGVSEDTDYGFLINSPYYNCRWPYGPYCRYVAKGATEVQTVA